MERVSEEEDIPALNINNELENRNIQNVQNNDNLKKENNIENELNKNENLSKTDDKKYKNMVNELRMEYKKDLEKFSDDKILEKLKLCNGDKLEALTELMLGTSQIVEEDK